MHIRVHDLVQDSTDSELILGVGVENDMVFDPLGSVALTHAVPLFAGFGIAHEVLDAALDGGKVSIGLGFAPLLERLDPDADQVVFGCLVFDKASSHDRLLTPLVFGQHV